MIAQPQTQPCTAAAYLAFETESPERHEYINGDIVLMTGGTPEHNELITNLVALLKFALRGKPYRIFATDQRLWVPARQLYTYPDVMVTPKNLQRQPGRNDTIVNPIAIAEVLSPSTQTYDRDEKFSAYRTIPTFQEYLLIDQYTLQIEQHLKTDNNQWLSSKYEGARAAVLFSSLPFKLPLADLYENILPG